MIRHWLMVLRVRLNRTRLARWLACAFGDHDFALHFPEGWLETTPNIYRSCIHCSVAEPDERPWLFVRRAA